MMVTRLPHRLGEFQADVAAAKNDEVLGQPLQVQGFDVDLAARQFRPRRHPTSPPTPLAASFSNVSQFKCNT